MLKRTRSYLHRLPLHSPKNSQLRELIRLDFLISSRIALYFVLIVTFVLIRNFAIFMLTLMKMIYFFSAQVRTKFKVRVTFTILTLLLLLMIYMQLPKLDFIRCTQRIIFKASHGIGSRAFGYISKHLLLELNSQYLIS